jgi:hypothetical protein
MSPDPIAVALESPGHLWFPSTRALAKEFAASGGRVTRLSTGHLVFYRSDGRRFLATDPQGHPLHECEWTTDSSGSVSLTRARLRLDWGRWVGLKPAGLINTMKLNLAAKPGWQRIGPDDLRGMAAQALRVPLEEVQWFYRDEDFDIDKTGMATIRHRKDAFYLLENGGFERARFLSCMGAMHWDHIDFLPVVELFKSLLPGTGSAAFELIRGLYDDQQEGKPAPRPLHYRGIPTYPSEAAFRLFSSFFVPQTVSGGNALSTFMDPQRAHRLAWLPSPHPPVRYFDPAQRVCLTVQKGIVQKATFEDDSAGASYVNPTGRRVVPLDRSLQVDGTRLTARDRERERELTLSVTTAAGPAGVPPPPISPVDWRDVFEPGVPPITPVEAYGAVLFYPDDEREIDELAAQPFVADYLQDLGEQDRDIGSILSRAEHVLIQNGDAVISTCVLFDRPRHYTVQITHPAYAQRQAQQLWTQCAEVQRWDWLHQIRFRVEDPAQTASSQPSYDLVYRWLPYETFAPSSDLNRAAESLRKVLKQGGHAFLVAPSIARDLLSKQRLQICWEELVENLPTFRMHRMILPLARLKAGLTLFHLRLL